MKVVINKCYGGFGLSARAVRRICELKGRPCFFFRRKPGASLDEPMIPATAEDVDDADDLFYSAYDIPNPHDVLPDQRNWHEMTTDERRASNEAWEQHTIPTGREIERHDLDVVRAVEELGDAASGRFAKLKIVEIPDGVEYEVDEYDGMEHVAELHRTWG